MSKERELLSSFVQSEQEVDVIELTLKPSWSYWCKYYLSFFIGMMGGVVIEVGGLNSAVGGWSAVFFAGGVFLYILGLVLLMRLRYVRATWMAFKAMIRALSKVESTLGTNPISKERKVLARQLRRCALWVRRFHPITAFRFQDRIIKKCSIEASQVILNLILLVLLGDDDELKTVKITLESAISKLGHSKWIEIRELHAEIGHYESIIPARHNWSQDLAFQLVSVFLAAIPAIPIVVSFMIHL